MIMREYDILTVVTVEYDILTAVYVPSSVAAVPAKRKRRAKK